VWWETAWTALFATFSLAHLDIYLYSHYFEGTKNFLLMAKCKSEAIQRAIMVVTALDLGYCDRLPHGQKRILQSSSVSFIIERCDLVSVDDVQMLLDTHAVKTLLLEVPSLGGQVWPC